MIFKTNLYFHFVQNFNFVWNFSSIPSSRKMLLKMVELPSRCQRGEIGGKGRENCKKSKLKVKAHWHFRFTHAFFQLWSVYKKMFKVKVRFNIRFIQYFRASLRQCFSTFYALRSVLRHILKLLPQSKSF